MAAELIRDFLQTQGLKLSADEMNVAYLTVSTVMNMGNASIERSILWREKGEVGLCAYIEDTAENEAVLKQVFMALDSVFSRAEQVRSAAVYAAFPSKQENGLELVCLAAQGAPLEQSLPVNDDAGKVFLAARTALSGWMNVVDDTAYWMTLGELEGGRNQSACGQLSIPISGFDGAVSGVVHVEFSERGCADETAQKDWAALALALIEPVKTLLGQMDKTEEVL